MIMLLVFTFPTGRLCVTGLASTASYSAGCQSMASRQTERNRAISSRRPMLLRCSRTAAYALTAVVVFISFGTQSHAQAALLLEQPYGFFGTLNPTGHMAIYLDRI